ncbi:MAG: hypothetical protein ACKO1J_20145 [Tagaea sp.]
MDKIVEQVLASLPRLNEYSIKAYFVSGTSLIAVMLLMIAIYGSGYSSISALFEDSIGQTWASAVVAIGVGLIGLVAIGAMVNVTSRAVVEAYLLRWIAGDIEAELYTNKVI